MTGTGKVIVIHSDGRTDVQQWQGVLDADGLPDGPQGLAFMRGLLGGDGDEYFEVVTASWDGYMRHAFRIDDRGWPEKYVANPHAQELLTEHFRHLTIVGPMLIWIPPS